MSKPPYRVDSIGTLVPSRSEASPNDPYTPAIHNSRQAHVPLQLAGLRYPQDLNSVTSTATRYRKFQLVTDNE